MGLGAHPGEHAEALHQRGLKFPRKRVVVDFDRRLQQPFDVLAGPLFANREQPRVLCRGNLFDVFLRHKHPRREIRPRLVEVLIQPADSLFRRRIRGDRSRLGLGRGFDGLRTWPPGIARQKKCQRPEHSHPFPRRQRLAGFLFTTRFRRAESWKSFGGLHESESAKLLSSMFARQHRKILSVSIARR